MDSFLLIKVLVQQEEAADVRALQRFRVAADAKPAHSHGAKAGKDGTHLSRRVEGTRADAQEADTHNVLKAAVRASSQVTVFHIAFRVGEGCAETTSLSGVARRVL
jgi:hypothetical protein